MKLHIKYCGYMRNDGTYNEIYMDTETKSYWDFKYHHSDFQFVEAYMSRDVNALRKRLQEEGWNYKGKEYINAKEEN